MRKVSTWVKPLLLGGGVLNLLLAILFIALPVNSHQWFFGAAAFLSPQAVQVWGMLLATMGIGYVAVSFGPLTNTAVLLMGLLANLLFAFFLSTTAGSQFWQHTSLLVWVLAALLWCGALVAILRQIAKARKAPRSMKQAYLEPISKTLSRFRTQRGKSLLQLSNERPTLVVFLRKFSAASCRETLHDIRQQRRGIEDKGTQIVLVHLAEVAEASLALQEYQLGDLHHISDPNGIMYKAFGLNKGAFNQLMDWRSWIKSLVASLRKEKNAPPVQVSRSPSRPGVFLINKGEIIRSYRHSFTSPRPDFREMASEQAA